MPLSWHSGCEMSRIDIQVEADSDLLSVLRIVHDNATSNRLRRMIDDGRVHIDGEVCRIARTIVATGQNVSILPRAQGDAPKRQRRSPLELPSILYEDDFLLVVDKPPGLLSVATSKGKEKDTMHARAFEYASLQRGRVFIVHRLDRETSGCMLFAKDERTKHQLQEQFADRSIERIYHAILLGHLPDEIGLARDWIQESKDLRVRIAPHRNVTNAKEAITHWKVEDTSETHTFVRLDIRTGRRAQIRLQMAARNAPVVGDTMHGQGRDQIGRLCLHASSLKFIHPNGETQIVNSQIPDIFRRVMKRGH